MIATLALLAATHTVSPQAAVRTVMQERGFKATVQALRDDHERMVAEIIQMTEVPSPPFGESERATLFARLMRESGFAEVRIDEIGNVIALRPGRNSNLAPLVIAAHLDTVFPKGTVVKVRREGTKLMAPGIGDDTRGLAVLMSFARAMNRAGIRTDRDILFVGDVGEEGPGNLRGIRHLFEHDARAAKAAAFISFDSSGARDIVTQGVGSRRYHVVFSGPGGHSFDRFGMVNPLVPLGKLVDRMYGIHAPSDPRTSYSASVAGGGTSVNTIPAQVFVDIDIRSVSPAEVKRIDTEIQAMAAKAVDEENSARSTRYGKVSVQFDLIGDRPAGQTDENKGVAAIAFAASSAMGLEPRFAPVSTDANIPMSLGIPAIAIGSGGTGGGEHSPEEWIDTEVNESIRGMSVGLATIFAIAGAQ